MRKKHQVVKFKDIAEKLPELEGKRLEEITKVLGYRNLRELQNQPLQAETKQSPRFYTRKRSL